MARPRSEARESAYRLWRRGRGKTKLSDIARKLGVSPATVRKWKSADDWEGRAEEKSVPKRRGAQPGNRNAAGMHEGGPAGNENARTHGAYARLMAERMTDDERLVWAEAGYSQNVLEALRLEVRAINIQQLRLMTRLSDIRAKLECATDDVMISDRGVTIPDEGESSSKREHEQSELRQELYAIERALDRASGRKTRLLQLLYDAGQAEHGRTVNVYFGQMPAPGETPEGDDTVDGG